MFRLIWVILLIVFSSFFCVKIYSSCCINLGNTTHTYLSRSEVAVICKNTESVCRSKSKNGAALASCMAGIANKAAFACYNDIKTRKYSSTINDNGDRNKVARKCATFAWLVCNTTGNCQVACNEKVSRF